MSDYIHRAGRVGRVGSKHMGHVTSLVTYAWDVDLLWKIEVSMQDFSWVCNRKITFLFFN